MIAGTVLVFGACGNRPAAAMRRGTVGLLGENPPSLLVTFRKSCVCQPTFLRVIFRHLESLGLAVPSEYYGANYGLYHGDRVSVGRGEILIRETGAA
jgi:formylmethanofuran dehydrogenase subunit C